MIQCSQNHLIIIALKSILRMTRYIEKNLLSSFISLTVFFRAAVFIYLYSLCVSVYNCMYVCTVPFRREKSFSGGDTDKLIHYTLLPFCKSNYFWHCTITTGPSCFNLITLIFIFWILHNHSAF